MHWLRGGLPLSFLARTQDDSLAWRKNFVQTFLERDLPQWGIGTPAASMMRFWTMLAHYHGQTWNAAEPARSMGVTEPTVRRYLDLLTGVFMIRQLQLHKQGMKLGVAYIRVDAPRLTPSMRIALEDLKLDHIAVVYPGSKRYPLAERVTAVPFTALLEGMKGIFASTAR